MDRFHTLSFSPASEFAIEPGIDPTGPATSHAYVGTPGPDVYKGTSNADTFDMTQGGKDVVVGRAGNDEFDFGATFRANDRINGGSNTGLGGYNYQDRLLIAGNYAGGVIFGPHTVQNVEAIILGAGFNYKLTTNDGTVAANGLMIIDGSAIGAGNHVTLDGSAETDGHLWFFGGRGQDNFLGGAQQDTFSFNDHSFAASDHVDGGTGKAELQIQGNYSSGFKFGPSTIANIADIYLVPGYSYNFKMNDGNVAAGDILYISAPSGAGDTLAFNGSAEKDGSYNVAGGPGDDILIGGHHADYLAGYGGADRLTGGPGHDTFHYGLASDSTSTGYDTIVGINFNHADHIFAAGLHILGIDKKIKHGTLSTATFDHDLHHKLNASHLHTDHAVVFTPDAGTLSGKIFLVIDINGTAGYQAGQDLVIELDHPAHLSALDVGDFV